MSNSLIPGFRVSLNPIRPTVEPAASPSLEERLEKQSQKGGVASIVAEIARIDVNGKNAFTPALVQESEALVAKLKAKQQEFIAGPDGDTIESIANEHDRNVTASPANPALLDRADRYTRLVQQREQCAAVPYKKFKKAAAKKRAEAHCAAVDEIVRKVDGFRHYTKLSQDASALSGKIKHRADEYQRAVAVPPKASLPARSEVRSGSFNLSDALDHVELIARDSTWLTSEAWFALRRKYVPHSSALSS